MPLPRVDWSLVRSSTWLVSGPDGVVTDTGRLVWETTPVLGESAVARDGTGGFVWVDLDGLWWLPAEASRPRLVSTELPGFLVGVTPTDTGPVAVFEAASPHFVDLSTGLQVPSPDHPRVRFEGADPATVVITAANGLEAKVTAPEVTVDAEGQPADVTEPARLVVTDGSGTVVVDFPVGSFYAPWATLHDFDGRRVILSRAPFEPALPEESFFVVDLSCGACLRRFVTAAGRASLVGPDTEWDGSNPDLQPGVLTGAWLGSDAGIDRLGDGTYLGFLRPDRMTSAQVAFDLAVWFSDRDANVAAREDGESDVPVANGYYIRNEDPTVFTESVSNDVAVTSVWFDADDDLANAPITYAELLDAREPTDSPRAALWSDPWWITLSGGEVVRLDEQYVP